MMCCAHGTCENNVYENNSLTLRAETYVCIHRQTFKCRQLLSNVTLDGEKGHLEHHLETTKAHFTQSLCK